MKSITKRQTGAGLLLGLRTIPPPPPPQVDQLDRCNLWISLVLRCWTISQVAPLRQCILFVGAGQSLPGNVGNNPFWSPVP